MKIQEGEAGQEKEQEKGQESANGEAEKGEKRAENGDAAVEENGEVAKKNEEQQESEEEEKENESSERVKNGTKENGRKTEAAPSETKTGRFVKSEFSINSNVIRYLLKPKSSTPFFRKTEFFSEICIGNHISKLLEVCLNSESM
jgi:hypothetical protein